MNKADIQGNVLRGYTYRHAAYVFLQIEDASAARTFLRSLEVTSATPWTAGRPRIATNVCLSFAGMRTLVRRGTPLDAAALDAMASRYPAFAEGMQARREALADPDLGPDSEWTRAHLWVSVFAEDEADLAPQVARVRATAGLRLLFGDALYGRALVRKDETCFEHFGFQDNISNPEIEGAREDGDVVPLHLGNGKRVQDRYAPIRAGEFLLGHANESGDALHDDALARFVQNGTFAVFRDLKQNVHTFRRYLRDTAAKLGRTDDEVGALIVGRRRDGTPLADFADDDSLNDFGYSADRAGARCPLGSHVRRTHPRDASGVVEVSHRLLRRGMPYGPVLEDNRLDDDGKQRGLYFIVFNADIERQFEFVQRRWCNGATGTGLDDDLDPLLAGPGDARRMVLPGKDGGLPRVIDSLRGFVELRGGGYFFMPSLAALRALTQEAQP